MAVCCKRETLTGARGVRASRGICLAYVEKLVHSPGIVMGAFRLLVCNIRNSCLPVCRLLPRARAMFQLERAKRAPCATRKWYYLRRRSCRGQDEGSTWWQRMRRQFEFPRN